MAVKTVIGLTGAFGSGCSQAATTLRDQLGFQQIRLSLPVREAWKASNKDVEPSRQDLQKTGDQIRIDKGVGALVQLALEKQGELKDDALLVVDGIRNVGEVKELRDRFGYRFILFAVVSSLPSRWSRVRAGYRERGKEESDFLSDDARDRDEETETGQQVQLCVDQADIILDNSEDVTLVAFQEKVVGYANLVSGELKRYPTEHEIQMHMAYANSHFSKCLKRRVGAVLVRNGQLVGAGYNENPIGTKPCVEEDTYGYRCYRDIIRTSHLEDLAKRGHRCPVCGNVLAKVAGPPWYCEHCSKSGVKTDLGNLFFPDRAMNWCTAVHGEVWAILAAGERSRGSSLYTTTFPCFQCCEKIIQAGVQTVYYTEAYPDAGGEQRLELAKIDLKRFEGVRSASFERIFAASRPTSS